VYDDTARLGLITIMVTISVLHFVISMIGPLLGSTGAAVAAPARVLASHIGR
jgi:hypothetical protein